MENYKLIMRELIKYNYDPAKDCEHLHLERNASFQCLVVAVIQMIENLVRREQSGGKVTDRGRAQVKPQNRLEQLCRLYRC